MLTCPERSSGRRGQAASEQCWVVKGGQGGARRPPDGSSLWVSGRVDTQVALALGRGGRVSTGESFPKAGSGAVPSAGFGVRVEVLVVTWTAAGQPDGNLSSQ